MILVVSSNDALREAAASLGVEATWAHDHATICEALSHSPERVLVDLNLEDPEAALRSIETCKKSSDTVEVIAFLHEQAGRQAILASLAGADRVIPQSQLLDEMRDWG